MAAVIEFYVPKHFQQKVTRGSTEGGKLIEFSLPSDLPCEGPRATCDPSQRRFESAASKAAAPISKKSESHVGHGYVAFWE